MTTTKTRKTRLLTLLLLSLSLLGSGCVAERAYREAAREEKLEHWDMAVLAYQKAVSMDPGDARSKIGLQRVKLQAALQHLRRGRMHRSAGQLDLAQVELEESVSLDPTNDSAQQELKKALADIEARRLEIAGGTTVEKAKAKVRGAKARAPMLSPSSDQPINVTFPPDTNIKKIYQALCAAAGINVIYDPQLKDDKFSLDVRGMTFQKALEVAMRQAGHFYKVLDEKTIIVAQDTNQNRKEYEDLVIRTFFLSNGDVKDVSSMVRSILDLRRMGTIPQLNAIVIRDTADKVAVAERLIEVNDKAKAEVVIDVELLQLYTQKILELGTQLSAYSITASYPGQPVPTSTPGATATPAPSGGIPWQDFIKLGINDFNFTVPAVTFNFIKQNTDAELLAKPQLRIAEGEKAQLVIGDRVPIPVTTINTQTAIGQVGVVPITSFQYQDVGIKIDIEPRVHHNKEVSLKLTIEVSNLNGSVKGQNGQEQPIIGTRTITTNIRLKDGETTFLAGLIRREDGKSKTGIPFLGDLPIIGPLFSDTKTQRQGTELYLTLTPHITRAPQITENDLVPMWVGTENNVAFSGLSTRLESPSAPGSPFDPQVFDPQRGPKTVSPALPGPAGTPLTAPGALAPAVAAPPPTPSPGTLPLSPPAPKAAPTKAPRLSASGAPANGAAFDAPASDGAIAPPREVALYLEAEPGTLRAGESTVVSVIGPAELANAGSMELTLEWDPLVTEVTGIAAGPWKNGTQGLNVRFESERTPGRARVQMGTPTGVTGLPNGVLARVMARALASGTSYFRISAGTAFGRDGRLVPAAPAAAVTVEP